MRYVTGAPSALAWVTEFCGACYTGVASLCDTFSCLTRSDREVNLLPKLPTPE